MAYGRSNKEQALGIISNKLKTANLKIADLTHQNDILVQEIQRLTELVKDEQDISAGYHDKYNEELRTSNSLRKELKEIRKQYQSVSEMADKLSESNRHLSSVNDDLMKRGFMKKVMNQTVVKVEELSKYKIELHDGTFVKLEDLVSYYKSGGTMKKFLEDSIWDHERVLDIIDKGRNEEIRLKYCENQYGQFVDARIYNVITGRPSKRGLCLHLDVFETFVRCVQRANDTAKHISKF